MKISILLNEEETPEGTVLVAHGLEYDIMAWSDNVKELKNRVKDMVAAQIHKDVTIDKHEPFSMRSNVGKELLPHWWKATPMGSQKIVIKNLHPHYSEDQKEKLKGPWKIEAVWRRVTDETLVLAEMED